MQRAAVGMLKKLLVLLAKIIAVFVATAFPFWVGNSLGITSYAQSLAFASRFDVLGVTTLAALLVWLGYRKFFQKAKTDINHAGSADLPYAELDRIIHNFAFGSTTLRKIMLAAEGFFFRRRWSDIAVQKPVFITSLPRAGTTILLNAMSSLPSVATHTYRDMPFVLSPVLWSKLSRNFQKRSAHRERAHADGLTINEDSPEAFEEVLWRSFFPHKYAGKQLALWHKSDAGFTEFFSDHMRKIICLRRPEGRGAVRYVSKNNANIARVPAILEMYPDAFVLIPVRNPLEHAVSMFKQHKKFLEQQAEQPFVKKYMQDIGHFEFGALHYPIQFPGYEKFSDGLDPDGCDYWLAYWIAAFSHLANLDNVYFLSYEWLVSSGEAGLSSLCRTLQLEVSDKSIKQAAVLFNEAPAARHAGYDFNPTLKSQALDIYAELIARSAANSLAKEQAS